MLVIGAIGGAAVKIIRAVNEGNNLTVSAAIASRRRGAVRDRNIQEVHLLVNSRLLTVLRMLVSQTKKEAERTGNSDDIQRYQSALSELSRAEAAAARHTEHQSDEHEAVEADRDFDKLVEESASTDIVVAPKRR